MYCNFHDAYIQFNSFFDGRRDGAWGPSQFSALMAPNAGPAEPGGPGGHVSPPPPDLGNTARSKTIPSNGFLSCRAVAAS